MLPFYSSIRITQRLGVTNIIPIGCSLNVLPGKDVAMLLSFNELQMCLLLNRLTVVYTGWSELSTETCMV